MVAIPGRKDLNDISVRVWIVHDDLLMYWSERIRGGVLEALLDCPLAVLASSTSAAEEMLAGRFSCSWIFSSKDSIKADVVEVPVEGAPC